MTREQVKVLAMRAGVNPTKALGQNFLLDESVVQKIVAATEVSKQKIVLEIGPGLGVLTRPLINAAKEVYAYEIDLKLVQFLNSEFKDESFKLIDADALRIPFLWDGVRTLVSNVPYHITSELLLKIFANAELFDIGVLMMQKEVVERILARPGHSNYSRLSLTCAHFAKAELVTLVPASAFWPEPSVESAVVKLWFKPVNYQLSLPLLRFFDQAFSQRRKTLINNLKSKYSVAHLTSVFTGLNLSVQIRPQELSYEQFCAVFKALS